MRRIGCTVARHGGRAFRIVDCTEPSGPGDRPGVNRPAPS
ncbi:hypothetical protein dsx2_1418 [Desulfovibrio sp. X2]|nr:hypothetical protein dsx2_1418 [Desulfovibrio sp. X2]